MHDQTFHNTNNTFQSNEDSILRILRSLANYFTGAYMLIALLAIIGWSFHVDFLRQPFPNLVAMNPITAICFLLAGCSFFILPFKDQSPALNVLNFTLIVMIMLIGGLRISEANELIEFQVDQILFSKQNFLDGSASGPHRMAISSAISFLLLSMALLFFKSNKAKAFSNYLSFVVFLMALFSIVGYLYHVRQFFDLQDNDPMSVRTAIGFVLASVALIFHYPSASYFSVIASNNQGGLLARILIPATIVIPILFGFIRLAWHWQNPLDVELGVASLILTIVMTFLPLVLFISYVIGNKDQLQKIAETKFQGILESAPDAMIIVDQKGYIQIINAQTEILFGYKRNELLGQKVEMLIPQRFAKHHSHYRDDFFAYPKTRSMGIGLDLYGKKKNGEEFPVEISLSPFHTENGLLVSAAIRDITERKNAANILELAKKDFQLLVSSVKDYAIFLLDKNGYVVSWNSGAEHIKGYKAEEIIGQPIDVFYTPEELQNNEPKRNLERALKDGHFETEGLRVKKDGTTFYADIVFTALFDDKNAFYGYAKVTKDISEKRKSEEHIRFLANITDNIQDIIITSDNQFRITRWNEAAERLLEWKSGEVIGKPASEFLNVQYPHQTREQILRDFSDYGFWQGEVIYHTKSGTPVNVLSTASIMKDTDGQPMGNLVVARDITERKEAEKKLEEFEHFFNNSNDFSCIANKEGYFEILNPSFEKVLGYSKNELAENPFLDFVHPDDIRATLEIYDQLKSGATVIHFTNRYRKKNGSYLWFDWNATPNPLTGKLYCIARDITDRRNAEEALNQLNEELEQKVKDRTQEVYTNEKRFRALIENNYDIISLMDSSFNITYRSPSAFRIMGWSNEELENLPGTTNIHPEDLEYARGIFNELITHPGKPISTLFRNQHKAGHYLWMEGTVINLLNDEGVKSIVFNFRDVTERKNAEEKLIANEKRFRALIENSYDVISLLDESFKVTYRSPSASRILGWTNEELENQTAPNVHPDDLEYLRGIIELVRSIPGKSVQALFRNRHKDGHYLWLEGSIVNYLQEESLHAIVFNFRDVTQRKELEELLVKSNTLARIGSWEVDLIKGTVFWSEITKEIHETETGYIPDLATGINFYKEGTGRDLIKQKVQDAIESGTPWDVELQIVTAKNNERWIRSIGETEFADEKCVRIYGSFQDITERKNAEIESERLKERLQLASQSAHLGLWDWDIKNNKLIWDEAMYRLYNLTENEFTTVYDGWASRVHEEDRQRVDNDIQLALANKKDYKPEFRIVWPDSSVHYINASGIIERDNGGNAVRMTGFNWDVTERKNAEEKLNQERLLLRTLIDNLPDYIYVKDLQSRHLINNRANVELMGASSENETLGKSVNDFFESDMARSYIENDQLVFRTGKAIVNQQESIMTLTGKRKYLVTTKVPIRDESNIITGLVGISRDITWQKQAEEKVAESERLYRTIASSMPETAVFIIDSELRFILAEGDLITKLGHTKEKLLGNFARNALSPDRYAELLPSFLRALKGENFIQYFNRKDYHIVDKFVPFKNEDGEIYAAMIVVSDITDIKRAEEALAGLNTELERKVNERTAQLKNVNGELESFSYSVSHDLRAPLRAINGYAKMLEEDYNSFLDDNGKRFIGVIRQNASQMGQLIDDLLSFSRLGRKEVQKEKVDLQYLVQSILEEMNINTDFITMNIHKLHVVWADKTLLKQVMVNYISNAVKYSSKTERPCIEIKTESTTNEIVCSVRDNGSGFDMNYGHKLFQVFQRLHSQEEYDGTGVGLAIVSRIITKHGGRVWAEGEIGKGATFYFSLPK